MNGTRIATAVAVLSVAAATSWAACGSCGPAHHGGKEHCTIKKACCGTCGGEAKQARKQCEAACKATEATEDKAHGAAAEIDTAALATLVQSKAAVVLDARTGKYDDGRRIPGAKALSPKASEKEANKAIGDKDQLVVTYCSNTQCPASNMLATRLKKLGYSNILEYSKGIEGWAADGQEVHKN